MGSKLKALRQRSPTFLSPGAGFVEGNFSTVGGGDGFGMILVHHIQAHLLLCGLVPNRPGLVPVCSLEVEDLCFKILNTREL